MGDQRAAGTGARSPRQEHVLDAAEACFVRNGFHRTTMVDIARESGMSQGNFYRYYASKEALILALAEREAEGAGAIVVDLVTRADHRAAVMAVLTRYFVDVTRETAVLRLDIWAEATRSTAIAELIENQEREAQEWFVGALAAIGGRAASDVEPTWIAMSTILKGMIVNRALFADYDPRPDLARLSDIVG